MTTAYERAGIDPASTALLYARGRPRQRPSLEELRAAWDDERTYRGVGRRLGVAHSTAAIWLAEVGIYADTTPALSSSDLIDAIEHGWPMAQIAKELNRAARIMGAANGGQVLVSDLTAGLVEHLTDVKLVDLGSIELKGVIEPPDSRSTLRSPTRDALYGALLVGASPSPSVVGRRVLTCGVDGDGKQAGFFVGGACDSKTGAEFAQRALRRRHPCPPGPVGQPPPP